ncbi:MAG: type II toxin-antitoxin system RelE/ParE family toxin [Acinetobacter sp.]|nr:MAG: type II toxin-antitoxin system RelE/ParE family toxin [Acinetobacter sp.]
MKNGYSVVWTPNASNELEHTIAYLKHHFTEKELTKLARKIESTIEIIANNPDIFPKSEKKNIHKVVLLKFNTMYYPVKDEHIEILSFFSNRQSQD